MCIHICKYEKTKPKIVFTGKENMSDHTCKYLCNKYFNRLGIIAEVGYSNLLGIL